MARRKKPNRQGRNTAPVTPTPVRSAKITTLDIIKAVFAIMAALLSMYASLCKLGVVLTPQELISYVFGSG